MSAARPYAVIALGVVAALCLAGNLQAQRTKSSLSAGEQRNAEKGLKDNRYFFFFINSSVTNHGTDEDKKIFTEAIRRDMIAQLLYMKFMFSDSFHEIRRSQELLMTLYRTTLNRNIGETKKMLHTFAPGVIKTGSARARLYLRLGYREMSAGKIHMGMADNYRENLYSMRLYEYTASIKKVQQGKRYAFLSVLESTFPLRERDVIEFDQMGFKDLNRAVTERAAAASGAVPGEEGAALLAKLNRIGELRKKKSMLERRKRTEEAEKVSGEIDRLVKEAHDLDGDLSMKHREYAEKKELYALYHADSYYRTSGEKSLFDRVWEDPRLEEVPEYGEYLKKQ
jgi:hypothetical protein